MAWSTQTQPTPNETWLSPMELTDCLLESGLRLDQVLTP